MVIVDDGTYKFVRKTDGFLEVELNGEKYNGRYIFRQIDVKKSDKLISDNKVDGDEVGVKNEKMWIMWKPKDQTLSAPVKKIAFKYVRGILTLWESEEIDKEVENE